MMKNILQTGLVVCLFLFLLSSAAGADRQTAGSLTFMVGDVSVYTDGGIWIDADFDMNICQGDQIRTGAESRCEITLKDASIVRMEEKSLQRFEESHTNRRSKTPSIFLSAGRIWLSARKIISRDDGMQVRTDKAVCAIRGTRFEVCAENDYTRISVYRGEVATWSALFDRSEPVRNPPDAAGGNPPLSRPFTVAGPDPVTLEKWVEIVKAFQEITIDADGRYKRHDLDAKIVSKDPWVSWNMARDNSKAPDPRRQKTQGTQ